MVKRARALDQNNLTVYHAFIVLNRYGKDSNGRPVKKAVIYTKTEHGIRKENMDADALRIIERLADAGFNAYVVGGAVRDLVVGNIPKDFDIVTDATPSRIKRIFRNARIIGKRFRLVHIFIGTKIFEVSTFRSTAEGSVGNNFGSMDEDVRRRDFTMNALYYDPIKEQVIDYVDGVRDIRRRTLRPVIPMDRIFAEDPVRMIRAVKYAVTTGAKMSFLLRHKIKHSAFLLEDISPSRLTEELLKIINGGHAKDIVAWSMDIGIYRYMQPNAAKLSEDNPAYYESYMASLSRMDSLSGSANAGLGMKLECLIEDFLRETGDWKEIAKKIGMESVYSAAWEKARAFVLPMNPQHSELEKGVRAALEALGVKSSPPKKRKRKRYYPRRAKTVKQGAATGHEASQ